VLLAAEQMTHPADVEAKRIETVDLDQRRPAAGPARKPLHQNCVALRISGERDERGI